MRCSKPRVRCSPTNTPKAIPGRRYYGGCEYVDIAEQLAIDARLQSCSTAASPMCSRIPAPQANEAVFMALLQPGDTFMGMSLAAGGHLTHGSPGQPVRQVVQAVPYGVRREDHRIDYDELAAARPASTGPS